MAAAAFAVPVIGMEKEKLAAAASWLGCFRVMKHGLSAGLQEEMRVTSRSLFDIRSVTMLLNDYQEVTINWRRLLTALLFWPLLGILRHLQRHLPLRRPSLLLLHPLLSAQREIICEYVEKLHGVVVEVGYRVVESLGLVSDGCSFDDWLCHMRLNHYNFSGNKEENEDDCHHEDRSLVLRAHSDTSFLTIIQEDNTDIGGGMEIMKDGKFVAVDHPPPPGTFLINIGDTGKAWSNGRLRSVEHRVVRKEMAAERTTLVMFMLAPKCGWVQPHAAFVDSQHPRLYKSFEIMKYRKLRKASGSLNDQLPLFA